MKFISILSSVPFKTEDASELEYETLIRLKDVFEDELWIIFPNLIHSASVKFKTVSILFLLTVASYMLAVIFIISLISSVAVRR